MEIREFGPDDVATAEAVVEMVNAVDRVDSPWSHPMTTRDFVATMRHGWDGEVPASYAAFEEGSVLGALEVWTSEWDNTHLAWLWVAVHPEARGQGRGSEIFEFAVKQVRGMGRRSVGTDGWDNTPSRSFADRNGLPQRSSSINRRQYLDRIDPGTLRELYDESAAAGSSYELLRIPGRTPVEMLDAVAEMTAAINDAPTDDLDIEDEVFPRERVADFENASEARGRRIYRVIARHRVTGELAGHTVVHVEVERPEIGHQMDTSVVRAHRGHRLGLLVKTDMLRWLAEAEPTLRTIDTWNAESNDHMIEVNERLGYEVLGRALEFQVDV